MVARVGKVAERPVTIAVTTRAPERPFTLDTGGVTLEPGSPPFGTAASNLTGEALLRLVYGRLDDAHLTSTGRSSPAASRSTSSAASSPGCERPTWERR